MKRKHLIPCLIVAFLAFIFFISFALATTEYENHYPGGSYAGYGVGGTYWYAQTFTVGASSHTVSIVTLSLYYAGWNTPSGNTATIGIRATSGGVPTGSDLTNGTIGDDTVASAAHGNPTLFNITVTSYVLSANTQYAIVIRDPSDSSGGPCIKWAYDTDNGYGSEQLCVSTDSGSSWTGFAGWDFWFEIWGTPPTESITVTSSPTGSGFITVDGSAVTTPHTYTWNIGDSHAIAANSPANTVTGQSQYLWQNWSDSDTQSHNITVPASNTTYTATFQLQYYLTVGGGNGPSGQGWYNSSATTTVTNTWVWNSIAGQSRTALTNYYLDTSPQNPSRSNTGNYTTSTITMSTYHNVTFTSTTQYYLTLTTATTGTSVNQSGSQTSDNWYDTDTSASISATTPYLNATTNRFIFQNWVWTQTGAAEPNSSSNPYSISMTNYVSATAYWSVDLIKLFSSSITSPRVNVGTAAYINLTFEWQSDNTSIPSGFTLSINGTAKTVSSGWINFTDTSATVAKRTYQISNAEGGGYYVNSVQPSEIWDNALISDGSISSSYLHVGSTVNIQYLVRCQYDNALINNGNVYLNGSAMTYIPGTGYWSINVSSATLGNQTYHITAVSGNTYGITSLNDTMGYVSCQFYANLNLTTTDINGNPLTQTIIYLNNGSSPIPSGLPPGTGVAIVGFHGSYTQTVSPSGLTSWTGQTNSTVTIYATWYGLTVNQTFTYNFTTDTALNLTCLAYPYTVSGIMFWAASNATITSSTYKANILTVNFNSTLNNYMLIANCPIIPRYILNCTYDITLCYTPYSYLELPIWGNATISVSYESWSDDYIQSTNQLLSSATIVSGTLEIQPSGTPGDIGTLTFYCGSLGQPTATTGFTTTSYSAPVLNGNYVVSASALTLSWVPTSSSSSGTTGTTSGISNLAVNIIFNFPTSTQAPQTINGTLYVTWTNYPILYIWQIACGSPYSNWIVKIGNLPLELKATQYMGNITEPVTLTIPANTNLGSDTIPCSVTFQTPTGLSKTVGASINLNIISATTNTVNLAAPDLLMPSFVALFAAFIVVSVFRRKKAPKEAL